MQAHDERKIYIAIYLNTITVFGITALFVSQNKAGDEFINYGPRSDLYVLGYLVNTNTKYGAIICLVTILSVVKVVVEAYASFPLKTMVNTKHTSPMTSSDVLWLQTIIKTSNNLRYIFDINIATTQLDIALTDVVVTSLVQYLIVKRKLYYTNPQQGNEQLLHCLQ